MKRRHVVIMWSVMLGTVLAAEDFAGQVWWKPYSTPCTERENIFAFTEKPAVKSLGNDRYEITFAAKGNCDVTVSVVDPAKELVTGRGTVVRHLGSGVLGSNAPAPFQKNSLKQTLYWNGKDDLDEYPKEPEKLKVRVSLGLKPEFDKNVGGTSLYDIPGRLMAVAADKDGVYVFSKAHRSRPTVRKFGHDMKYIRSLVPPPANLPESKLQGMGYIEYEPGKRAIHAAHPDETMTGNGVWLTTAGGLPDSCQPAVVNGRIYYLNDASLVPSHLYYINTDGSTDLAGCSDRPFLKLSQGSKKGRGESHNNPRLAASPDGKWIYMVDMGDKNASHPVVWRCASGDAEPAKAFIGTPGKPGSDNASLNGPCGIDTDAQGRVYVCDRSNQRVQVFSPEGQHLNTIKIESPEWVWAHRKTGAVYVMHEGRVQGRSLTRLTKFTAFPDLKKVFHFDGMECVAAALDSWSEPARVWTGGGMIAGRKDSRSLDSLHTVRVWEEQGNGFRRVFDFEEEARKHAGKNYIGRWNGSIRNKVVCDGSRENVYLSFYHRAEAFRFDLASGSLIERVLYTGCYDDTAFDKRGYMHAHFNPSFYQQGVGRFDPDQPLAGHSPEGLDVRTVAFKEVPYDYGVVPATRWKFTPDGLGDTGMGGGTKQSLIGVLDVRDQGGSKYFQDGVGVNMRGDVAEECNIYYVPKMDELGRETFEGSLNLIENRVKQPGQTRSTYAGFLKEVEQLRQDGRETYYVRRTPGLPLSGATVWTFDRTGELRDECAAVAGNLINGVQIDEDGKLYFTVSRQRLYDRKVFLAGRAGVFGGRSGGQPFSGTYVKSRQKDVKVLVEDSPYAPVPLEQKPDRPVEVGGYWGNDKKDGRPGEYCWVEGAEWLYAGASPIVVQQPCSCPTMRCGLDWYKRSYVIEQYRHSFGVLDSNGNLILHAGRYGNRDSGDGPNSKIPVGGDNIAISFCQYVSATDNYLCYDDNGERLAVLRLNYHAEETAGVGGQ